ncbi:FAD-binding monooxygenase [Solwaraspora sp. WMMD406]|uniref:FAD-dependent oxidoreductase n=1 Tax=Solwaraspora sp. WMMD406 TaxID=3016095 RepID=UPI002417B7FC|nr:FAD-binding monooxygenase [Solwaraspora sp. WMMD406]MDG4764010.1 FAD-binding monooxygenase [Solwaraspora sp. WMMD406]
MSGQAGGHAVVLGASMAGLLAARVLSDSYRQVTIVDRDELPDSVGQRRSVPQGRHLHALLARGGQLLDDLFPGLTAEVRAAGVPSGDLLGGIRWLLSGHRIRQVDIGQPVLFPSRPLLEGHVRDRVRKLTGVTLLGGLAIAGLTTSSRGDRVTGVRVRAADGTESAIEADLTVDATGRGSRTPLWLGQVGYPPPETDRIHVDVGYASRSYRLPPGALGSDRLVLQNWTPDSPYGAGVAEQEGGRHIVTLAGILGHHPPTDPAGFAAFAANLPFPDIYQAFRDGEPLGDPVAFRYPANVRHRYERLARFPSGLLVIGDAVCSFNPIYGQGMTVSALQADALRRLLATGGTPSWRRYFRAVAAVVDVPWGIATGADLAFPGVVGRRTAKVRLTNAYLPRLHAAAVHDPTLAEAFVRVTGLLDPPVGLLRPDRVLRVWRGWAAGRRQVRSGERRPGRSPARKPTG